MSLPDVGPSIYTIERFWKRVAEVTTRYHAGRKWIGGEEIILWNQTNLQVRTHRVFLNISLQPII
jgi:hypothetical protein